MLKAEQIFFRSLAHSAIGVRAYEKLKIKFWFFNKKMSECILMSQDYLT